MIPAEVGPVDRFVSVVLVFVALLLAVGLWACAPALDHQVAIDGQPAYVDRWVDADMGAVCYSSRATCGDRRPVACYRLGGDL